MILKDSNVDAGMVSEIIDLICDGKIRLETLDLSDNGFVDDEVCENIRMFLK